MLKHDLSSELSVNDKIQVVKGELNGTQGVITCIEAGMITFRPTNLEDFDDCLEVNEDFVEKYFEQGDVVRIL
jgi:transcription elongation factor